MIKIITKTVPNDAIVASQARKYAPWNLILRIRLQALHDQPAISENKYAINKYKPQNIQIATTLIQNNGIVASKTRKYLPWNLILMIHLHALHNKPANSEN